MPGHFNTLFTVLNLPVLHVALFSESEHCCASQNIVYSSFVLSVVRSFVCLLPRSARSIVGRVLKHEMTKCEALRVRVNVRYWCL